MNLKYRKQGESMGPKARFGPERGFAPRASQEAIRGKQEERP